MGLWGIGEQKGKMEGEGDGGGELEGMGYLRWRKNRDESKERDNLIEGAIVGLARNLVLGKFSGLHKDNPS